MRVIILFWFYCEKRAIVKSTYFSYFLYFDSYRLKIPTTESCTKTKVKTQIISDSSARPIVFLGTKTHPETRKKSEKKIIMTKKLARKNIEQVRSRPHPDPVFKIGFDRFSKLICSSRSGFLHGRCLCCWLSGWLSGWVDL